MIKLFRTLKGKISLICIYLAILNMIVGFFSVSNLYRLSKGIDGLMTDNYKSINALNEMVSSLERQDYAIMIYTKIDKQQGLSLFSENSREFKSWYDIESNNVTETGEGDKVKLINKLYLKYDELFLSLQKLTTSETEMSAIDDHISSLTQLSGNIRNEINELIRINEDAMFTSKDLVTDSALHSMFVITAIISIVSIGGLITAVYLAGRILKPIYELKKTIKAVKAGNINQFAVTSSNDELGELIYEFNNMTKRLQQFERSTIGELLAEKNKSVAIVKNISEPLIVLDRDCKIMLLNKACELFFEVDEKDAIHKYILDIVKNTEFVDFISRLSKEASKENMHEIIYIPKGNKDYCFNIIATPVKDMEAAINGYVILLQNITDIKELESIKSKHISSISHEFKTPLTSIMMGLSLLMDGGVGVVNEQQKKLLETVYEDVNNLLVLVNDLLKLAKLESGESIFQVEPCSANEIIKESIRGFSEPAERKDIKIIFQEKMNLPHIRADFEKTVWVLNNLLSNAIRYTGKGGSITIHTYIQYNSVCIAVTDTGSGIPEEYLEKVFDKFFQVEGSSSEYGGTGLGLSIAREIIEANGGVIWCDSKVGEGSTFTFTLPLCIEE